jgi:hypothetical protein
MIKKTAAQRRAPAQNFDRSRPVPIRNVMNFGPVTASEFESIGIKTLQDLEALGFEESARRWVESFPERLCVSAFVGIVATLDGIKWTQVTDGQKSEARRLVNLMRSELGLPAVAAPAKKRTSPKKPLKVKARSAARGRP